MTRHRIVNPETLRLYQKARDFFDSAIPTDVELRKYRQQACIDTALALHQALRRTPEQISIMETIGIERVPADVLCHGEAVADWVSARDLRRSSRTTVCGPTKAITGTDCQQSQFLG